MGFPTLLCIDDIPQALELRKAALESHGYTVKLASSSHTAIKMLEKAPVAAVLLEYKHEGMDAEAVAWYIKQQFPSLPIILLSGYSELPGRILWLVDEYVMKSEMPEGLVQIIERATRRANSVLDPSGAFPHGNAAWVAEDSFLLPAHQASGNAFSQSSRNDLFRRCSQTPGSVERSQKLRL